MTKWGALMLVNGWANVSCSFLAEVAISTVMSLSFTMRSST